MGEPKRGNIASHNGLDERGGRRVMHADFFHTGWSGGTARGRRVKQAYCFHAWRGKDLETNGLPAGMGNGA